MMNEEIKEDQAKLKEGVVIALKFVAAAFSAATVVNPIFGIAGSLMQVALHHIDDEDIRTLKREFGSINRGLDELSQQNRKVLMQLEKETVDGQFSHVEENLKHQFKKFIEVIEAPPTHREGKKDDFMLSYSNNKGDQDLYSLYESVVGPPKVFSGPMLEVYLKHSQGDRRIMERLCKRLTYLLCIGLFTLMGYSAFFGDDVESLSKDWAKKMKEVQTKMQEVLSECK